MLVKCCPCLLLPSPLLPKASPQSLSPNLFLPNTRDQLNPYEFYSLPRLLRRRSPAPAKPGSKPSRYPSPRPTAQTPKGCYHRPLT